MDTVTWTLIDSSPASASANMARDAQLLEAISVPTLHLYEWEQPSVTHGYFIRPEEHLHLEALERRGIALARRPTGGGIVFHTHDIAFSIIIPKGHSACSLNTLERYHFINSRVLKAVEAFLHRQKGASLCKIEPEEPSSAAAFCMAKPTRYDVMLQGRKVGGAAQRKTASGFLHQGTICLQVPPPELLSEVLVHPEVAQAMGRHSFALDERGELKEARREMREHLKDIFT